MVIMPDFYRSNPWPANQFPPKSEAEKEAFGVWWDTIAGLKVVRKDMFEKVLPFLFQECSVKKVGCMGFCWGGLMVCLVYMSAFLLPLVREGARALCPFFCVCVLYVVEGTTRPRPLSELFFNGDESHGCDDGRVSAECSILITHSQPPDDNKQTK